ncbi:hypothetical protein PP175_25570 (plasmid) [Aneurinibacillus sp. Ricciae_BoGa-3]|uniref:hypothetical protein n=1 Tax=Aneurinibacillus sp. Ricciae_BoGa-3 TaxID=3022697 RepID=UPI0023424332|nr:hypothetical protein [Aneurinibacillus sp. Ricciae_BoGa-3]WCK57439.1 hypothetical protein PP175_25570 [Aneurinibacillus sp. Ricciae_BoGa-3]
MSDIDKKLDIILNTIVEFKEEFNTFKKETNDKLERLENTMLRMESDQPKDIKAMLQQINEKLDERDFDIQALNKRVFKVESQIERLSQQ